MNLHAQFDGEQADSRCVSTLAQPAKTSVEEEDSGPLTLVAEVTGPLPRTTGDG